MKDAPEIRRAAEAIYANDHYHWTRQGHDLPPFTDLGQTHQDRYERYAKDALDSLTMIERAERTQPQEMAMARLTTTASAAVEAWAAMAQPADDHSAARYLRMARLIDELDLNLNAYESLFTSIISEEE